MAGLEDPLVAEGLQVDPRALAHGLAEVVAVHGLVAILGKVVPDSLEEDLVAQVAAHRVQDQPALVIAVAVKRRAGTGVKLGGDRARVAAALAEVSLHAAFDFVIVVALSAPVFRVKDLPEKDGESLPKPHLSPILVGDQVAEPLVREFVRHRPGS